jgi:hypothetical protein
MNELSKFLVEQILLEEPSQIKKTIVVYVGRFQPFHKGHYATYDHLVKKFGKDNVYIGTSNKVEKPKSPFNFKEKKEIMTTMFGVPSNRIVDVKNPYAPTEVLKKFNDKTTAFVTVVGEKDSSRLGGKYFQKWDGTPTEGYKDRGYVYISPMQSNSVSGTEVRLGLGTGTEEQKKNFFVDRAYSKFNKKIFSLISNKLQESIILESKEDEKYTHIGYGKYKLKGREKDNNSPTFTKDDSGKYIPTKSEEPTGEKEKPQPGAVQGAKMFKHAPDIQKKMSQKDDSSWKDGKDGWEIIDDERAQVKNIRDYTDEEYEGETGEYFENEVTKNVAPNAFKDESDMIQKMKDAKPVYLSSEEMQNMNNTDVGEILSASEEGGSNAMKARGKELADEYGKDWNRLEKGIQKGNDVPAPIALRDKNGDLHLVAGNTRLMSFTAYGKKLPVKVIEYDGEFNKSAEPKGGGADTSKYSIKNIKRKLSGWAEKEKEFFKQSQHKPNSEERRSWGEALRDKAKGARNAIVHGLKHEAHTFKTAAKAVGKAFSEPGGIRSLEKEEKKAIIDVTKKVVLAGLLGVATGGLSHGVLPFAQHLAIEFVPHVVGETLLIGAGKAALFADTNEDERLLNAFMEKVIEGLESMKIPNDVLVNAIDSYNEKKKNEQKIPGGLSKGMTLSDIAKKHKVSVEQLTTEFKKGYKVEREHTTDTNIAKEIALDHLFEDPKYYTKLASIEKENIEELAPWGYPDQEWMDNHEKEMKKLRKQLDKQQKEVYENIVLPVKVGDTILMGKFKNKKVVVKSIGKDEYGMPTINGKKAVTFRLIKENINESKLLLEGGAYGHMNHPFDTEINLTFGSLKNIVNLALEGELDLAREKTDGQALAISWVGGRLVAARNKSHLKNKGAGALDIKGVADKFSGRGELEKAYNFAMQDLTSAIKSLSEPQRKKIFKDGACFMNLEVIYPTSVNVIPYGQPLLVFHGTMEYDEDGNAIGENQGAARILAGMIKQINQDVQSNYTIQGPPVLNLPKSKKLSSLKGKFLSQISKLQQEFGLGDTDGVADYHQAWWENFVDKKSPSLLDNKTKMGLVKRWAFGDKGFRVDKNSITDEKTLEWAQKVEKEDHAKISKQNLMKFEDIFLGVGAEVLQFTSSVLTVNPDSAIRDIKKRLDQTIKDVKKSGDPKKVEKLKLELKRLNSIGGQSKIVPIEGIVFVYQGKTFKLTGAFASVNQLLGIFYG